MSAQYQHCSCRDCFETVIAPDECSLILCDGCDVAGCDETAQSECAAQDAYDDILTVGTGLTIKTASAYRGHGHE
jgi:hypothetical protein